MVHLEGPGAGGTSLGSCDLDLLVQAFSLVVDLYQQWIFSPPSPCLVLFSYISKRMPVVDVIVLVLFGLLWRRCTVSAQKLTYNKKSTSDSNIS